MRRIDQIEPFRVMQLLERARQLEAGGQRIVHMEIGEPDFPTPHPVIVAAEKRLGTGENFYTPSTGAPELQQALSRWYIREYGVHIAPERILITPGTSGAFSLIYAVLLEAGESVLLPDPGYPCQRNFVRLAGGEPINVPVGPETLYHLSAKAVEREWRDGTRAAVVINPANPAGTLIEEAELEAMADFCGKSGGYLISDEIYHGLTYGSLVQHTGDDCRIPIRNSTDGWHGEKAACVLKFNDDAIAVNGFSKRWAMTGWRIGWIVVPENLIDPARRVMQNIFIAAPTLSQFAAIAALDAQKEVEAMREAYDKRRRYMLTELPKLGFEIVVEPRGAFYIYANVKQLTDNSCTFCRDMLEKAGVAITPGEDFGSWQAEQHVRFSYATSLENLREGVQRIGDYLMRENLLASGPQVVD